MQWKCIDMEWREKTQVSSDTAGSRDPQYNTTLTCVISLTFIAFMVLLPACVQSNDSELVMLDGFVQTCKDSSNASEANSAVAVSCSPVLLFLEAAWTDLLFL